MKRERMVILLFAVLLAAIPVVPALLLSQHTPKSESESAAEQSKAADDLPDFSVLDVSSYSGRWCRPTLPFCQGHLLFRAVHFSGRWLKSYHHLCNNLRTKTVPRTSPPC